MAWFKPNSISRKPVLRSGKGSLTQRVVVKYASCDTGCSVMFGIRPARFAPRHYRAALIWAAIPLTLFNGRTLVGCGCTGHFEAVCRCNCCIDLPEGGDGQSGNAGCPCCAIPHSSLSKCPCCNHSKLAHTRDKTDDDGCPVNGQGLQKHRCRPMVLHQVTPGTVVSVLDASQLLIAITVLADFSQSLPLSPLHVERFVDIDIGPPPNDLVVSLHRLVI